MRFLRSSSVDAAFNLALEELLFLDGGEDIFMLWRNAPSIILGRHQDMAAEIDAEAVRALAIPVVRRITGGGAVYHDLGNFNFSLVGPAGPWTPKAAEKCAAPVLEALRAAGFDCVRSGRNDLLCGGVKVSGTARAVQKNRMLFHGTILYDADLTVLARVLKPDPEKMRSKGVASVRARVGDLRAMAGPDAPDTETFLEKLAGHLADALGAAPEPVPEELLERAGSLADRKYRSPAWNAGTPFAGGARRKRRFSAGTVAAETRVENGRLAEVRFTGDFFVERPVAELEAGLAGCAAEFDAVLARLRELAAETCIAGVGAEELAELVAPRG